MEKLKDNSQDKPKLELPKSKKGRGVEFWEEQTRKAGFGSSEYYEARKKRNVALKRRLDYEVSRVKPETKQEYTLEDLERERQWDSGFGPNNPGAAMRELKAHYQRLEKIENDLKKRGILELAAVEKISKELNKAHPNTRLGTIIEYEGKEYQLTADYLGSIEGFKWRLLTDEDKISIELDRLHPNAKSKTVVDFKGSKYQIKYFPLGTSRSGKTVHGWGHEWEKIS